MIFLLATKMDFCSKIRNDASRPHSAAADITDSGKRRPLNKRFGDRMGVGVVS